MDVAFNFGLGFVSVAFLTVMGYLVHFYIEGAMLDN